MLDNDDWEYLHKQYKNLIYSIAWKIGGDKTSFSVEDCVQELNLVVLYAVEGFANKTDKPPKEFIKGHLFNSYIKTCLWHKKNNLGAKITQKFPVRNTIPIIFEDSLNISASETNNEISFYELIRDPELLELIDLLVKNPKLIRPSGKVNQSRTSKELGISINKLKHQIKRIKNILSVSFERGDYSSSGFTTSSTNNKRYLIEDSHWWAEGAKKE